MTHKDFSLKEDDILLLNTCLATLIKQIDDKTHLSKEPTVPRFDVRELCRLRAKLCPSIGVTESIQRL
jgi:hypothetical protein